MIGVFMINIALCFDNNFVRQAGVLIKSIICSNPENQITFYCVSDSISQENKASLEIVCENSNAKVDFRSLDITKMSNFPVRKRDHISLATYYRLLLPLILPEELDRVLYLDCDMICVDDLSEFYNTNFENNSCCMVADMFYDRDSNTNRLSTNHYFNAGMLLINLKYWREKNISEKLLDFVINNANICIAHDQDAINAVLARTIGLAPARYNIQLDFLRKNPDNLVINDEKVFQDAVNAGNNPCIIHYTGPSKPWHIHSFNPYDSLFDFFQDKTIWKGTNKTHEFKGFLLFKKYVKIILEKLHLRKKIIDNYNDYSNVISLIKNKY